MAQLIDSSVFIGLERRSETFSSLAGIGADEPVALASITASELLAGVHRADSPARRLRRETFVEAILEVIPVLPFDLLAARTYAQVWSYLVSVGQLIGTHDLLIAATALSYDYAVLTDNLRDFQRVPGLVVRQPPW